MPTIFLFDRNNLIVPTDEPTDAELVRRTLTGDDAAFSAIAERYRGRAFGTASRFARGKQELEDLVQDIFVKVWKGLGSFREDAPFEHWFMKIVVRTCYDFLRKHRKRRENEVLAENSTDYLTNQGEISSAHRQREAWEIVQQILDHLGEKDRTVITLLDLEERTVKEIADLTGWSESNVKVRAHRARKKMKTIYETHLQS